MRRLYWYSRVATFTLAWALVTAACSPQPVLGRGETLQLASYNDELNNVSVSIAMSRAGNGAFSSRTKSRASRIE